MYVQINTEYFLDYVKLQNDIVVEAAQTFKFMLGWSLDKVNNYCMEQYWEVRYV